MLSNIREQIHLWHGWPQQGRNPKSGYSYFHAVRTIVPPQPDYTSYEHFSICFPLELVWHFVVVRQAHYTHVAPVWADGAAVKKPACWSDWKGMFGISRLSWSVWRCGRAVCLGVCSLLSGPAMVLLGEGKVRVWPWFSHSADSQSFTPANTHRKVLLNELHVLASTTPTHGDRSLKSFLQISLGHSASTVLRQRERRLFWLAFISAQRAKWKGFGSFLLCDFTFLFTMRTSKTAHHAK